jgi:hypothetical protein
MSFNRNELNGLDSTTNKSQSALSPNRVSLKKQDQRILDT